MSDPLDRAPAAPPIPHGQQWAAPSVPPFGTPAGPAVHPAYAPPPGYTGPYVTAPHAPAGSIGAAHAARSSRLGVVALIAALGAAVLAPLAVAIAAFNIGIGAGREIALGPMDVDFDWSVLTPVRDWVLLGEIAFWVGTVLGVWAIVQGIVAIVTGRGRRAGIAAVVIGALGAVIFAVTLQGFLAAGFGAGSGIGG